MKGHYRRALAGEIPNFTGVSDPYEEPLYAELVVESDKESPELSVRRILSDLEIREYLEQVQDHGQPADPPKQYSI